MKKKIFLLLAMSFICSCCQYSFSQDLRKPSSGGSGGSGDTTFKWSINGSGQIKDSIRFAPGNGILFSNSGNSMTAKADTAVTMTKNTASSGGDVTGPVISPSIAAGVISNSKLANNSVDSNKILNGSIRRANVRSDFQSPYADTAQYSRDAAYGDEIALGIGDTTQITTSFTDTSFTGVAAWTGTSGGLGTIAVKFYNNGKVTFSTPNDGQIVSNPHFYFRINKKRYPVAGVYQR